MTHVENIVAGCGKMDRISQEQLYRLYYPAMFTLCKKFFKDPHKLQSALNNGMLTVFKNINQFDAEKGSLFNWIYTIVRNSCLTLVRNSKTNFQEIYMEEVPDTEIENTFESDDWDRIFECLNLLPPTTRAVCTLFYIEEYSIKEIVEELDIKEGTVKWHLNESRNRLRQIVSRKI